MTIFNVTEKQLGFSRRCGFAWRVVPQILFYAVLYIYMAALLTPIQYHKNPYLGHVLTAKLHLIEARRWGWKLQKKQPTGLRERSFLSNCNFQLQEWTFKLNKTNISRKGKGSWSHSPLSSRSNICSLYCHRYVTHQADTILNEFISPLLLWAAVGFLHFSLLLMRNNNQIYFFFLLN